MKKKRKNTEILLATVLLRKDGDERPLTEEDFKQLDVMVEKWMEKREHEEH